MNRYQKVPVFLLLKTMFFCPQDFVSDIRDRLLQNSSYFFFG